MKRTLTVVFDRDHDIIIEDDDFVTIATMSREEAIRLAAKLARAIYDTRPIDED